MHAHAPHPASHVAAILLLTASFALPGCLHAQEPVDEAEAAAEVLQRTENVERTSAGEGAETLEVDAPPDALLEAPVAPVLERVVLETNHGTLTLRLFPGEAPLTVANFKRLVSEGFYDGEPFYRVVAGHVIQAGDGGESEQPTVPLEAGGHPHLEGAVGLARDSDPNSGSTEFYICLAPRPHLDGNYAVFGQLVDGYDVLREIGAVKVDEEWLGDDRQIAFHSPKEPVLIERAYLESGDAEADEEATATNAEGDTPER